jgi:predicted CoA-substrate-specific enzyme activase
MKHAAKSVGICLGASTVSVVEAFRRNGKIEVGQIVLRSHEGNPGDTFKQILDELDCDDVPTLVTGRKFRHFVRYPIITEPEAVEYALDYVKRDSRRFDALVSAGGETFMVYRLDHNHRIVGISTGNKCASGTGEFFLQQIRRMDVGVEEAIKLAETGKPYAVSGRCSVFCKSDCTHALNKGVPIADVTSGLCRMIAQKIIELLAKVPHDRVLVVGGTAQNRVVIESLRRELPEVEVPKEAPYFEALGAAIAAFERGKARPKSLFRTEHSNFSFLPPLREAEPLVTFNRAEFDKARPADRCIVGLDVGSTTTKAILLRNEDDRMLGSIYLRTNGNPVEASRACYKSLLEQLGDTELEIVGIGVTGSGRQIAGLYSLTDGIINEIIAHAAAAVYFDREVDTIFEIGGQDAKYTHITNSVASDYAMNEACSAGTGSFLEESAYESLGIPVTEIADLALEGDNPPNFNDQCAAFISSDIKNAAHEGISRENILAGLVYSICFNYTNRVKGHRPVGKKIFMQGGVCYNRAVPLAMASILRKPIVVPPEPGLMGAFGVALELKKRLSLGLVKETCFDLKALVNRKIEYEKPFTCAGGKEKCDLKCQIQRIRIEGELYPFGGACNRYYNMRLKKKIDSDSLDLVKVRRQLLFEKYVPAIKIDPKAPRIGINTSFATHWIFPLYYNFFAQLGCEVVIPDQVEEEAFNRQTSSLCFPAQISLGLFENLIQKSPDYYFMPHIEELYVPKGNTRKEFSSTCIFIQGEAFWLRQAFHEKCLDGRIIAPTINFAGGWERGRDAFIKVARDLGFGRSQAARAFQKALEIQRAFESECKTVGKKALEDLRAHPERFAVVLLGRPYNAFAPEANKGIPKKLTSRGEMVIPFDMLPYDEEPLRLPYRHYMHWETGQRILRASQIIKRDSQLYAVYITNFLCAIDSFLVTYFRKTMGTKPSLTLELDGHTADAGINTRIEAFFDIVQNYRDVQKDIQDPSKGGYRQAKVVMERGKALLIDSAGRRIPLKDPRVKMILPAMNVFGNRIVAAVLNRLGVRTEALPRADSEVLRLGRGVTTCKECLPMLVCVGSMLKYLKYRKDPAEKLVVFQPKAAGYCRMGQYHTFMNLLIRERRLKDVALISLANEERYAGLGTAFTLWAWKGIVIADAMDDIQSAIWALAKDVDSAVEIFNEEFDRILEVFRGRRKISLYRQLRETAARLKSIPLKQPFEITPQIVILGEIFVRKDPFSNLDIAKRAAEKGFITRISPISDWIYYLNFMTKRGLQKPEFSSFLGWLEFFVSDLTQQYIERKIKRILSTSGLLDPEIIDIEDIIRYSKHLIPPTLKGEPGLIAGVTMRDALNRYAGVINIGPFGCMPVRFTESVLLPITDAQAKKESYRMARRKPDFVQFSENERIPFLTIEADGNPYPQLLEARFESFCLQAARIAVKQNKRPAVFEADDTANNLPNVS